MSIPAEPPPEPPPGPQFVPAPGPPPHGPQHEPAPGPPFEPPPRRPHQAPPWILAAVILTLSTGLPSLFFLSAGYDEDPTASETVSAGTMIWLIGAEFVIGIVLASVAVGWYHALQSRQVARAVLTAVMIVIATVSGFVTGFLGAVAIAYERHPTWDDA